MSSSTSSTASSATRNSAAASTRLYTRFAGIGDPYRKLVLDKQRLIIGKHMAGDVDNLAHLLKRVAGRYRYGRT